MSIDVHNIKLVKSGFASPKYKYTYVCEDCGMSDYAGTLKFLYPVIKEDHPRVMTRIVTRIGFGTDGE